MERTRWLDGLRGIASTIVALDNLIASDVAHPFRSYWTHPPAQNEHWLQLPPFRILFSVNAMAALFFVLSGYAIALDLLRLRNNQHPLRRQHPSRQSSGGLDDPGFYARLSSAAARRVMRLFLPVLLVAVTSQFLYFTNLYRWQFDEAVTTAQGLTPWTAPGQHVCYLVRYMADLMNPFSFPRENDSTRGLNAQFWTMPATLRGSGLVYLLIVATASWRALPRLATLSMLSVFFLANSRWDIFTFIAGLSLAEFKVAEEAGTLDANGEKNGSLLPSSSSSSSSSSPSSPSFSSASPSLSVSPVPRPTQRYSQPVRILNLLIFLLGFYLLCLPDDPFIPFGFRFLLSFQPSVWSTAASAGSVAQFSWKSIGAVLTVFSIGNSPALQHILGQSDTLQYLGRISFSLYLVHQSVYQLLRDPIKHHIWRSTAHYQYPGAELADRQPFAWAVTWLGTLLLLGPIVVYVADSFARNVETRCIATAKELDKWLSKNKS